MRRGIPLLLAAFVGLLVITQASAAPPEHSQGGRNFRASLSGAEEVPPVHTRARGQAIFQLSKDGSELRYKLIVANIENVTAAHIHLAPAGVNGPVVVWLFGPSSTPGRVNGVIAEGLITSGDLAGPLAGQTLADLVTAMRAGNTYVNVHTSQFPGGEVRGQIR